MNTNSKSEANHELHCGGLYSLRINQSYEYNYNLFLHVLPDYVTTYNEFIECINYNTTVLKVFDENFVFTLVSFEKLNLQNTFFLKGISPENGIFHIIITLNSNLYLEKLDIVGCCCE
jgi:hypothetical protein